MTRKLSYRKAREKTKDIKYLPRKKAVAEIPFRDDILWLKKRKRALLSSETTGSVTEIAQCE